MSSSVSKLPMQALINPQSVALVGTSASSSRLTSRPLRFLQQHGYKGNIYPVTPTHEQVMDVTAYSEISAIPNTVEFAYILRGSEDAVEIFQECARHGVKIACILAGGFSEAGEVGVARQAMLKDTARQNGIRLIGPNSTGIVNTHNGFSCTANAAFELDALIPGNIAVISQSGSLIGTLVSRGQTQGIGFSVLASVGNEADLTFSDIGISLLDDPNTKAFALIIETIRDVERFKEFTYLAYHVKKPVFAYLIGQSEEGKSLTSTHTGAITGKTQAIHSFLKAHAVQCVDVFESIIESPAAQLRARNRNSKTQNKTVTIVSTTGGGGTILVDKLSAKGVSIASCSDASRKALAGQNIPTGEGKLIDVTMAGANPETLSVVLKTLILDSEVDILLVVLGSSARLNPKLLVQPFQQALNVSQTENKNLFVVPLPDALDCLRYLNEIGVACFRTVETCAEFISCLTSDIYYEERIAEKPDVKSIKLAQRGLLNEMESIELFETLGMPANARTMVNDLDSLPSELPFEYPCVAKIVSKDLPHKTEVGAVTLNIENFEQLKRSVECMRNSLDKQNSNNKIEGLLIQPMHKGICELLLGFHQDPVVGPMVTVAMGGVLAELYKDSSIRPAPVCEKIALTMLSELKVFPILNGYRNLPKADIAALTTAIAQFSNIASISNISEAEINPLLVKEQGKGIAMLDGLVRIN